MYNQPSSGVPFAATGITVLASSASWSWMSYVFVFCATFALVGAICAFRRTLPVPSFVRGIRTRRRDAKLAAALLRRNCYRAHR